jgi:hypothetical protein
MRAISIAITTITLLIATSSLLAAPEETVQFLRVPDSGLQPQAAIDDHGTIHLVYFKGDPAAGDLYYCTLPPGQSDFTAALRVNSEPSSAVALGTMRGAHLSLGQHNRPHIAWNPSPKTSTKGLQYTRLNDRGDAFAPQRSLTHEHFGLDGGSSLAADRTGNVYVAWHAPEAASTKEADRRVYLARSTDSGLTFSPESPASPDPTGACGCCGLRLFADTSGNIYCLYRSANEMVHRDIYLLTSTDHATTFTSKMISPMKIGICVMSSAVMTQAHDGVLAAWETSGQMLWARIDPQSQRISDPISPPGEPKNRKHPAIAENSAGQVLLAWIEGSSWKKGGTLAWQLFDRTGQPLDDRSGRIPGLVPWTLPAVVPLPDGSFRIIY